MIGQPHWFGQAKSTFGIVHWPDSKVRAGVVICPPVGYEAISIYSTLRVMAESLATDRFAVLAASLSATGNSLRTEPATMSLSGSVRSRQRSRRCGRSASLE
jgi:hypothetical protein